MIIKSIDIDNWKCFSEKVSLSFSCIEIFSFQNGSGKTSVLEAIYYGVWGKVDNKLSSYQNHDGQTIIEVKFELDGSEYTIHREFPKTVAILKKDNKEIRKSVKEVYEYMNSIVPYSLIKRLWFKGDIAESEVLSFNFFKNEVLSEQLKDPSVLYKQYSQIWHQKCREANSINIDNSLRDIKVVDKEIKEITSNLKARNSVNELAYVKAVSAKDSHKSMLEIENSFNIIGASILDRETIAHFKKVDINALESRLKIEESKFLDDELSSLNSSVLGGIKHVNDEKCKCVICGGEWKEDRSSYIKSILEKGFKSNAIIENIKSEIDFAKSIDKNVVEASIKYHNFEQTYLSCKNYDEIIKKHDENNDSMWNKLDSLNKERDLILRNNQNYERLETVIKEREDAKNKMTFLKEYLDKATAYYTDALLSSSNKILTRINDDYSNICISPEDNSLKVDVRGEELLVNQLSRGERTMVAMALIYSIRDIFTPDMPLIFDESFASLSEDNNYGVISFVKESQEQLFIITHNKSWINFNGYDMSMTNIRTEW